MIADFYYQFYNTQPIAESSRFLHVKATYYNPVLKKTLKMSIKDNKLLQTALLTFGEYFNPDCQKEFMPHNIYIYIYTYEGVSTGACSIQSALDTLKN